MNLNAVAVQDLIENYYRRNCAAILNDGHEKDVPIVYEKKRSGEQGYEEIGTGVFVPEENSYEYALERISQDEDLQKEMVEWFYSGNWVKED